MQPIVFKRSTQQGVRRKYLVILDGAVYEIGYDALNKNLSPFEGHVYRGMIFESADVQMFYDCQAVPWSNLPFAIKTEIVKIEDAYKLGVYSDNYKENVFEKS